MKPELAKQRFEHLFSERTTAQERWEAIERFIAPYRGMFFQAVTGETSIEMDKSEVYDGTALQSSQSLASNLHGNLTSPYVQWFGLRFRDKTLESEADAREWLEDCGERIWLALSESSFSREVAENYLDLTTFATTYMGLEPDATGRLKFSAIPLKEGYFEEDAEGKLLAFYRLVSWTPLQIYDKFGEDTPPDIKEKALGPTASQEKIECIWVVWKRERPIYANARMPRVPPKRRSWGYYWIRRSDGLLLGKEGGYHEQPVFTTRWAKVSESKYGHGPSHVAIYDVMALNRQEMLTLQALEKVIDPPQKATERGVLGDLDLQPGGLTIVRSMDSLEPMSAGTEWNVLNVERENRRAMIREYYLVSKLDLKDSPAMTATEVERRWQQMQKLLGPTLGRLQADLLGPVIESSFSILLRNGLLPALPEVLKEASGAELDIEYSGPLPIAQKADVAAAIERELGLAANIAQSFGPEALDPIDPAKAIAEHARLTAVPARIIRTDAEIKKIKEARQAAQQQAMELEQVERMAAAGKDAAQAQAAGGGTSGGMTGAQPPTVQ